MKTQLVIMPEGWPCLLRECRPGLFVFEGILCFKDDYDQKGVFCCDSGSMFWGGTENDDDRQTLQVQPVVTQWEKIE